MPGSAPVRRARDGACSANWAAAPQCQSAADVAGQTGWRESEPFSQGNRHDCAGIGGRIHLELEGGIGFHLGKKGGELGFGHGFFSYLETLGAIGATRRLQGLMA